jgi:predicted dehydrogenase
VSAAPITIGILGVAHGHAHSYAACLAQLPGVTLVGCYDADPLQAQSTAQRHATRAFASAAELLDLRPDGIIVCAENTRHAALVREAAGHTANILCEKPLATTLADASAMLAACELAGTRLQTAFPVRFAPPVAEMKRLLDRGEFGTVYSAKCANRGTMPGGWFVDRSLAGGGAVMDHTVHIIDLLRWFWDTEVEEVYAEIGEGLLHPDLDIDDAGLITFKLANGVYGTLDPSWSVPPSHPSGYDVKIELTTARGVVTLDAFQQNLSVFPAAAQKPYWAPWGGNMDLYLIADFVEMVRTGRPPSVSGHDGMKALEVALAAYRSARLGAPVTLPLTDPDA